MGDLSFLEKLKILVDVSLSSRISISSILILVFMGVLFLIANPRNKRVSKFLLIGGYILLVLGFVFQYKDHFTKLFDYMMTHFFIVFYFPNVAIYLAAIIATNIILMVTIFNFKEDRLLKIVNTLIYCMIHYFLVLILSIISHKKLDIFSQTSIYGNEQVSALISLTSIVFIVWVIFLVIYKIIRKMQKKSKERTIDERYIEVPVKQVNPNIIGVEAPSMINKIKKVPDVIPIEDLPPKLVPIAETLKVEEVKLNTKQDEERLKQYENMLTLEDYKLVLEILNGNKENANNDLDYDTTRVEEKEEIISIIEDPKEKKDYFPAKLDQLLNI